MGLLNDLIKLKSKVKWASHNLEARLKTNFQEITVSDKLQI